MLKSWTARYAAVGILIGLIFPMADTLSALSQLDLPLTPGSIVFVQFGAGSAPDRWIVDTLPLMLGVLLGLAGRQRDQRERALHRLQLVADIRAILDRSGGLDILLGEIAPKVAELASADACSFAMWDTDRNAPAPIHPDTPYAADLAASPVLPGGVPLVKETIASDRIQSVTRVDRSMLLALPLAVNRRTFGAVVLVKSPGARPFTQSDLGALSSLVDSIALSIDHVRTTAEIRRRARDMEAIGQVARSLAAGWPIDRILTTVAESTQVRFGVDYVGILTVDAPAGEFVMRAQAGPLARDEAHTHRQKVTDGLLARVYATGQMALTRDVCAEPAYIGVTRPETRSELILPLRSGAAIIGAMSVASRYVDAFTRDDITALHLLADQVSVAVENARLYEDAQRERQRLSAVLDSTGDAVIVTDAANRVQLFNRTAERLFGVAAPQVIGLRVDDSLSRPELIAAYRSAGETHVFELALSDTTTFMGYLTPVRDETLSTIGRVLTLHDVSDLKRLNELKSQMIRMASHDLRNPLNLAFGYVDLLENEVADRQAAVPLLNGLASGLRRMRQLIEDLLSVERIESSSERVREIVDMNGIAAHAADELRPQATSKRHTLTVEADSRHALVSADLVQARQVITNLISNAIKYTPDGGWIQVRVRHADDNVVVEVEDNGLGIPKEAQSRLFERFYRVRTKQTEDIEGTGLGLSLVKAIVEQHAGSVEVDSEDGRGSVFRVRLPALAEDIEEGRSD